MTATSLEPAVVILAATRTELMPTVKLLHMLETPHTFEGRVEGVRIVATLTGVGPTAAAAALIRLQKSADIRAIVNIGFAAGLEPTLSVGDLLRIRWVMTPRHEVVQIDGDVPVIVTGQKPPGGPWTLLTVDQVADTLEAKRSLYEQFHAVGADMESFQLAKLAAQMQIPYRVVRAVSDPADMFLPSESVRWVKADGGVEIGAVLRSLLRHPTWFKLMLRLGKHAKIAGDAVARQTGEVVQKEVARLFPSP